MSTTVKIEVNVPSGGGAVSVNGGDKPAPAAPRRPPAPEIRKLAAEVRQLKASLPPKPGVVRAVRIKKKPSKKKNKKTTKKHPNKTVQPKFDPASLVQSDVYDTPLHDLTGGKKWH